VKDEKLYLVYILESIADVRDFTREGRTSLESNLVQAAVLYKLQTMADATQHLSEEHRAAHPEAEWNAIRGFRNRLVHGYLGVNLAVVWNVIENYLNPLERAVTAILETFPKDEQA